MPEKFKHQILRFLKHRDYTPLKLGPLAKALGVPDEDYEQFKIAFEELRQSGRVVIGSKNLVSLPPHFRQNNRHSFAQMSKDSALLRRWNRMHTAICSYRPARLPRP